LVQAQRRTAICVQTTAPDVSADQVARRYALNTDMIFRWLRDARYAPDIGQDAMDVPVFLPIEIVNLHRSKAARLILPKRALPEGLPEIESSDGHRLGVSGVCDPEVLVRLIRGLSDGSRFR